VLAQSPPPNTKITGVATVELVVSQEPGTAATVTVGDYVGKSFQDAIMKTVTLESMGYTKADWERIQAIK